MDSDPAPAARPPQAARARGGATVAGFALGVGGAAVALAGPPLHFAYPDAGSWLVYGPVFLVGAALGGAFAALRGVRI